MRELSVLLSLIFGLPGGFGFLLERPVTELAFRYTCIKYGMGMDLRLGKDITVPLGMPMRLGKGEAGGLNPAA